MIGKTDWGRYLHKIRSREISLVFDIIPNTFESGLEIGAGDGYQSTLIAPHLHKFISSDLNFSRLKDEYKLPNVVYQKLDADNLDGVFEEKSFDFIFSSNVLEHLSNREGFLKNTHRLLSDDGYCVHIVPNRWMKSAYILFYYPHLFLLVLDRIVGMFLGKPVFRGAHINLENNINKQGVKKSFFTKLRMFLFPSIHGNYLSHRQEYCLWGKQQWSQLFIDARFHIVDCIPGPAFSGYGFGHSLLRNLVERIGISSEYIFILKKNTKPEPLRIAVITPKTKSEYLTNTIIDGIDTLVSEGVAVEMKIPTGYLSPLPVSNYELPYRSFVQYAKQADIILFCRLDNGQTNFELADKIDRFEKTVFIDGSELRGNNRLNPDIQQQINNRTYTGFGEVLSNMYERCAVYFRREKPYYDDIIPFPYGIERRYISYKSEIVKDIDFVCIFGQEVHPPLRKLCRIALEDFCKTNGFSCITSMTKGFTFDDVKIAGRKEFYSVLARAKVGISVSGGGYDTARFWETLANNCILITEKVDIDFPPNTFFKYNRVYEFTDIESFKKLLEIVGSYVRKDYIQKDLETEYQKILQDHSSKARMVRILQVLQSRGCIARLPFGL